MNSPTGWCLIVTGLLACWPGVAAAQADVVEDDGSVYQLSGPFQGPPPDVGFRFQADALYWTRNTSVSHIPIVGGPESFSLTGLSNNNYVGGFRLGAAWLIDPNYEAEVVWTTFTDWTTSGGGILNRAISFNGGQASTLVDPSGNANFINTGTFFRPISDAASDPLANPAIQNYDFLKGGSTYSLYSTSSLNDIQANFKTRRSDDRRYSIGLGYRNIQLNESTTAIVSGIFGTNDLPGGGTTHNTISDAALTAHGLALISGAADGWTNAAGAPTTLTMSWNGAATNRLNGLQGVFDASIYERGPFVLEGVLRAGVFDNRVAGTIREVYAGGGADNSVYGRTLTSDKDVFSFAGNAGLNGIFRFNDFVCFRAGYEAMFLTNTALSGNQQNGITYNSLGTASYTVQSNSSVIFHGARAGLEFVW